MAFHYFCQEIFSIEILYLELCEEFKLLYSHSNGKRLTVFLDSVNTVCKEEFSAESLFENYCDEFEEHVQQQANVSSDFKNENHVIEEDFLDLIDDWKDDRIVVDVLDFVSDAPVVLYLNEEIVEEEVFP